jgi:hypothetical protein
MFSAHVYSGDRVSNAEMLRLGRLNNGNRLQSSRRVRPLRSQGTHRPGGFAILGRPRSRQKAFFIVVWASDQPDSVTVLVVARYVGAISHENVATFCVVFVSRWPEFISCLH